MTNERSDNPTDGHSDRGGRGGRGGHGGHKGRGGRHSHGERCSRKDDRPRRYDEQSAGDQPAVPDESSPDAWFMGRDRRTVEEIVATDALALAAAGLTREKIALVLQKVLAATMAAMGTEVTFASGRLKAVCRESMGKIACPIGSCGLLPKGQAELTDTQTGRTFLISPLSVHLIEHHKFLQGRGCPFRMEPEDLAALITLLG